MAATQSSGNLNHSTSCLLCPRGLTNSIGHMKVHGPKRVTQRSLYVLIPPPGIEQKFDWWAPKKWLPRERLVNVIDHPPQRNGSSVADFSPRSLSPHSVKLLPLSPTLSTACGDYLSSPTSSLGWGNGLHLLPMSPVNGSMSAKTLHQDTSFLQGSTTLPYPASSTWMATSCGQEYLGEKALTASLPVSESGDV